MLAQRQSEMMFDLRDQSFQLYEYQNSYNLTAKSFFIWPTVRNQKKGYDLTTKAFFYFGPLYEDEKKLWSYH